MRIPTLLGLSILVIGLAAGVYLTLQNQTISSRATPEISPKNILVTNIEDQSASISWQTDSPSLGFVTFSSGSGSWSSALDDRDSGKPTPKATHHVTLSGLTPSETYRFRVFSGSFQSSIQQFNTTAPSDQNGLKPITGSILDNNQPLNQGLVFLKIDGISTQSTVVKDLGNFIIPLSKTRTEDLSSISSPAEGSLATLTVIAEDGKKGSATIIFRKDLGPIGPLKIDQDLDLTEVQGIATSRFDLNGDGTVNSSDYSIVLKNISKNPKEKRADLNGDGVVNKKDLDLIQAEINH